jgi:3-dehydroquinate synthase
VSAQFAPTGIQTMQDKPDINCRTVPVGLGERSYDIIIGAGLLAQAGEMISSRLGVRKCAVITDSNVGAAHLDSLQNGLGEKIQVCGKVTLFPGEATKRFSELEKLCERLLETGVERGDLILALGGGVIGDLGGFAASIVRRGIDFVQIPTSLLAQVDSSVGGKTGINTPQGKNLVGTFYQPRLVIIDTSVLETLPERQFRAGYAEVAKYGLLGDAAFFEWLEQNWRDVFSGGDARAQAIETSCKAKAAIVEEDEREHGQRALLNLGHTFGHALEAHAGYSDRLLHGEAIAIGMALAFEFSNELELCSGQDAQRAVRHLDTVGLPTRIAQIPGEAPKIDGLMALIAQDKKVKDGIPAFILAHGIGEAFIDRSVDQQKLRDFLSRKCDET